MYLKYAITCNKLQQVDPNGPLIWESLIDNAQRIDPAELIGKCDVKTLFDEGESYDDFIMSDEDSGCYKVVMAGQLVYFIQTKGYEFFFTENGHVPCLVAEHRSIFNLVNRDSMARLLLPANHALCSGKFGFESQGEFLHDDVEVIEGRNVRFRLFREGLAIAGLSVKDGIVDELFVHPDFRRKGVATKLFQQAKVALGSLKHSQNLTDAGRTFVNSSNNRYSKEYRMS